MKITSFFTCFICVVLLSGCVYAPPTGYSSGAPSVSKFDRAWSAAIGAFSDQGVRVTNQNRGMGVVEGTREDVTVTASVRQQADGSVRVQFDTSDPNARYQGLIDSITRSYQTRMGR